MLRINCFTCNCEINAPGALVFSPPNADHCIKYRVCAECWPNLLSLMASCKPTDKKESKIFSSSELDVMFNTNSTAASIVVSQNELDELINVLK